MIIFEWFGKGTLIQKGRKLYQKYPRVSQDIWGCSLKSLHVILFYIGEQSQLAHNTLQNLSQMTRYKNSFKDPPEVVSAKIKKNVFLEKWHWYISSEKAQEIRAKAAALCIPDACCSYSYTLHGCLRPSVKKLREMDMVWLVLPLPLPYKRNLRLAKLITFCQMCFIFWFWYVSYFLFHCQWKDIHPIQEPKSSCL